MECMGSVALWLCGMGSTGGRRREWWRRMAPHWWAVEEMTTQKGEGGRRLVEEAKCGNGRMREELGNAQGDRLRGLIFGEESVRVQRLFFLFLMSIVRGRRVWECRSSFFYSWWALSGGGECESAEVVFFILDEHCQGEQSRE